jgi:hypothetical protein
MVLLFLGIIGIAFCKYLSYLLFNNTYDDNDNVNNYNKIEMRSRSLTIESLLKDMESSSNDFSGDEFNDVSSSDVINVDVDIDVDNINSHSHVNKRMWGIIWACSNGAAGGSMLVPLHYVPIEQTGLVLAPSFALGGLAMSIILLIIDYFYNNNKISYDNFINISFYGILSGIVWNG